MDLKIAENIRRFRKERNMTQEQLAQAFQVTVGAVSKWEAGGSVPDIILIMEMARFFGVSVDVLLGYELAGDEEEYFRNTIRDLRNSKKFEEATALAEKGLQKYPNHFELVHYCAVLYSLYSMEKPDEKLFRRSLELFNHSLELISQNTDPQISEWTIRNEIAELYFGNDKTDKALELLKENNSDGVNNGKIGRLLVCDKEEYVEGLSYLSIALLSNIGEIHLIINGYVNAYCSLKKYDEAIDICETEIDLLESMKKPGKVSHFDMEITEVLTTLACVFAEKGDDEMARKTLYRVYKAAKVFDSAPTFGYENTKHFYTKEHPTAFDSFGNNAIKGVGAILSVQDEYGEKLSKMWKAICDE